MLREATVRLVDAGIVPVMLIHDGILFQETDPRRIEEAQEIMLAAGRETCNGINVGVDLDWSTMKSGQRYQDKRPMAKKMWAVIMDVLAAIGVPLRKVG